MSGLSIDKWYRDSQLHTVTTDVGDPVIPANVAKGESDTLLFEADAFKRLVDRLVGLDICLREQDLSFLSVERWKPRPAVTYVAWEGELPFLYQVTLPDHPPNSTEQTTNNNSILMLYIAEVLHRATGSGLGFTGKTNPPNIPQKGLYFDLRIARRFRYNTYKFRNVTWIERAESGRRSSVPVVNPGGSNLLPIG